MKILKLIFLFFVILSKISTIYSENRINIEKALFYLNEQLKLNVAPDQLIRACDAHANGDNEEALKNLNLDTSNATDENKNKVLKAVCKALKSRFKRPEDPTVMCNAPQCPEGRKKCTRNEWVIIPVQNKNCQKPGLDGTCLEFAPCHEFH